MAFFSSNENRVKCGKCTTEFDLNKNSEGCPLCGFNKNSLSSNLDKPQESILKQQKTDPIQKSVYSEANYLAIPSNLKLPSGKSIIDKESGSIGLWGMFNDYFSGKAVIRINANLLNNHKKDFISLFELIDVTKKVITSYGLSSLKGFPNDIKKDASVNRLIHHFIKNYQKMGLFEIKLADKKEDKKEDIWAEKWENILMRPTKEGLEFAQLTNNVFDNNLREDQVLTKEEGEWMINYLKKIDKEGFKEYALLYDVHQFIKKGNNGKSDLWNWFKQNEIFISYLKNWSNKADNPKSFEKQLANLAMTFGSSKVSLLRELGLIKNKRNDYTVIGELK